MPTIVPLVLTAGAAIQGLRARNRRLDAEEVGAGGRAEDEDATMRRQLADSDMEDEDDDKDEEPVAKRASEGNRGDVQTTIRTSQRASSTGAGTGNGGTRSSQSRSRPSLDRRKSPADGRAARTVAINTNAVAGKRKENVASLSDSETPATSSDEEPATNIERRRNPSARRPSAHTSSSPGPDSTNKRHSVELGTSKRSTGSSTLRTSTSQQDRRELPARNETAVAKAPVRGREVARPWASSSRSIPAEIPSRDLGVMGVNGSDGQSDVGGEGPALTEGKAGRSRNLTESPTGFGSEDEDMFEPVHNERRQPPKAHLAVPSAQDERHPSAGPDGAAVLVAPATSMDSASRPSARHSAHHWQRFNNLLHPNFLKQYNSGGKDLPRTSTWGSETLASENESERSRRGLTTPTPSIHFGRGARKPGRAADGLGPPAVSFQREVSVGGRLLHPELPSILRSRSGHADSTNGDPNHRSTTTPAGSGGRDSRARARTGRSGVTLRRTATADSDNSVSFYSETDGDSENDAADQVLGRSRKEVPRLSAGRGQGRGRAKPDRKPSRALSTLILAGGSAPLRGWARRKQSQDRDDADVEAEADGDGDGDAGQDGEDGNTRSEAGATDDLDEEEDDNDADSEEDEAKVHVYRKTPIISGIMAPFSIMLEVPGFTSTWYVSTGREVTEAIYVLNPVLLDVGLSISMVFAVLANLCIILRFLEVMRPKKSTLIAMVLLTLHDAINIAALASFGKAHAIDDGFTYSEGYWMTLGSTIASVIVNFTLVADYVNTKQFRDAGSGLTRKQRELVIMTMLVLFYLSIGALIYCLLLKIRFEDALYFSVCTLFTIGFGDILPSTTAARIVLFFYAPAGIVLVALVIATTRETILEQFEQSYKQRRLAVKQRYTERQEAKRVNRQLRRAVRLRQFSVGRGGGRQWLAENQHLLPNVELALPVLPPRKSEEEEKKDTRLGKILDAARAMVETGFSQGWHKDAKRGSLDAQEVEKADHGNGGSHLSKRRESAAPDIGAGFAMLTGALIAPARAGTAMMSPKVTDAWMEMEKSDGMYMEKPDGKKDGTTIGGNNSDTTNPSQDKEASSSLQASDGVEKDPNEISGQGVASECGIETRFHQDDTYVTEEQQGDEMALMEDSLQKHREQLERHWEKFKNEVVQQERNEFVAKMVVSGSLFLVFWLMGAGIFVATEKWNFFEGLYFGFVFFSTIGYGDFSPKTPSGRAFFIVWALFGVGILTVIFSVLGDAWGTMYKNTLADSRRKYGWKARWRRRRELKQKKKEANNPSEAAGPGNQPDEEGADPDQSQAPYEEADGRTGTGSFAPSDAGDGMDEGRAGDNSSSLRPTIRRGDTFSSIGGLGGDEALSSTTAKKRRQFAPDQLPLQLARAAMHLHSEASHLLESQRHVLAESVSSAPSLHRRLRRQLRVVASGGKLSRGAVSSATAAVGGSEDVEDGEGGAGSGSASGPGPEADEDEIHRFELEKLEASAVSALEQEGDLAGMAAVRQLFALLQYDTHLTAVIENSHALRETLVGQEKDLAELRARITELEADVEKEMDVGDRGSDKNPEMEVEKMRGTEQGEE
ncbi:unnamed protein product [Tilletia laevis]|nr:hypothetical protein CF336_g3538 [Tilletia laevis]KAE8199483.1 hypothetical protein CF328_g3234 [Tilletia controversa]CAD6893594.1 unnamed protein product [Tilletia caries]KAE8204298.1 hypothetical protein CF335_g2707 [Tilletia laevis]CAD6930993.1 unnamed protein product [Tilletia controversa]